MSRPRRPIPAGTDYFGAARLLALVLTFLTTQGAWIYGDEAGSVPLRADAGDDQVATVGRQVTLAGVRSEPRGQIGFRWVQIEGPPVRLMIEEGDYFSFVPELPGRYRFALLIAHENLIAEPATVVVWASREIENVPPVHSSRSDWTSPLALEDRVRTSVLTLPSGPAAAPSLAGVFERVAERMPLYASYTEAFQEMSRQLDGLVPIDPAGRRIWVTDLFEPLTAQVADAMHADGLDLRRLEAQSQALTSDQKQHLTALFHAMAAGAREAARLARK